MTSRNMVFKKIDADYLPFMNFSSYLAAPTDNNHHYAIWHPPVIINESAIPFAAVLAHEIRNPLTNIDLSAEIISSLANDENLKLYLDIIARNSARVNNLIKELLNYLQTSEITTESHSIHQL